MSNCSIICKNSMSLYMVWGNNNNIITTVVNCGGLCEPKNGNVLISGSTLGCMARYTCDPGYDVVGDVRRVCLENSTWSGSTTETLCKGKREVNI